MSAATPAAGGDPEADGILWPIKRPTSLWPHQRRALRRLRHRPGGFFAMDPGLGKTATVIAEAGDLFLDGEIDTLLVVAPNGVHRQWVVKAFPDWAAFPWRGFTWPSGGPTTKAQVASCERAMTHSKVEPALRVFAINYEALITDRGKAFVSRIMATSKAGVYLTVDESQRCKDHRAARTKALLKIAPHARFRRALSGTAVLKGLEDLWSQYAILDPNIIGEPSFWGFRARYCKLAPVPGNPRASRIVGYINEPLLRERIAPATVRVTKDVLGLKPPIFDPFLIEMEPAQARAYAQMEEHMMAALAGDVAPGGKIVTATIVLTQLQKLLQISSGFVMDEDREPHWLSDVKIDAARELVTDLQGEHVVVWAPYIPVLDRLEFALGAGAMRYRTLADIAAWQKKGGALIANPQAAGVGVDGMQVSNRAIYAANAYHLEWRLQSLDRIYRGGQVNTCFFRDLICEKSKDATVLAALKAKREIGAMTIDQLRELLVSS